MSRRLVLHVGAMKTGTTYVQSVLAANAEALGALGWLVPEQPRVVRAARDLVAVPGLALGGPEADPVAPVDRAPRWLSLVRTIREHLDRPGAAGAVVSMEFLSFARPAGVARMLESLDGLDVEVVLTVRDAQHALPTQWSTLVLGGFAHPWPTTAVGTRAALVDPPSAPRPVARALRRTQDVPRIVDAWSRWVPPERFHAVTVPPRGSAPRDEVWRRFTGVLGLDPDPLVSEVEEDNPQLGFGTSELLRRVNVGLGDVPAASHRKIMRRLTGVHLEPLRHGQGRPRLDLATAEAAVGLNARTADRLAAATTVWGDLADLATAVDPAAPHVPGDRPPDAPDDEVHEAAEVAVRGAHDLCRRHGGTPPARGTTDGTDGLDGLVGLDGLDGLVDEATRAVRAAVLAHDAKRRREGIGRR